CGAQRHRLRRPHLFCRYSNSQLGNLLAQPKGCDALTSSSTCRNGCAARRTGQRQLNDATLRRNSMRQSTRLSLIAMSLAITSLASPGAPIARAEDESHRSHIDRLAAPYIDNEIVVGMTVGIIHDGQTHVFGYGRVSKESAQPPNGDTIY